MTNLILYTIGSVILFIFQTSVNTSSILDIGGIDSLTKFVMFLMFIAASGLLIRRSLREGQIKKLNEIINGWEQISQQKDEKINLLNDQIKKITEDVQQLKIELRLLFKENESLREINMMHQKNILRIQQEYGLTIGSHGKIEESNDDKEKED